MTSSKERGYRENAKPPKPLPRKYVYCEKCVHRVKKYTSSGAPSHDDQCKKHVTLDETEKLSRITGPALRRCIDVNENYDCPDYKKDTPAQRVSGGFQKWWEHTDGVRGILVVSAATVLFVFFIVGFAIGQAEERERGPDDSGQE